MKHNYNYRLIKNNVIYTVKELSDLINIHTRTLQNLIREEGLNIINPNSTPFLIKGIDAKKFFQERSKKQKYTLQYYEFNCFHCHKAVESIPEEIEIIETGKIIGKNSLKIDIRGICSFCGSKLYRMSSSNKINQIMEYYWKKIDQ